MKKTIRAFGIIWKEEFGFGPEMTIEFKKKSVDIITKRNVHVKEVIPCTISFTTPHKRKK